MNKLFGLGLLIALTSLAVALPAGAQQVKRNAMERLGSQGDQFYHAPREFQIIDNRPIIRDFRQGPEDQGMIDLPPAPGAAGSGGRMAGGDTLPSGGMPLAGGPGQGYRTAPSSQRGLPMAGFGGPNSNMGSYHPPARALPGGFNTGVLGKMMNQQKAAGAGGGAPRSLTPYRAGSNARPAGPSAPAVSSYGGGYGSGGSGYGSGGGTTQTVVRGSLLRSK